MLFEHFGQVVCCRLSSRISAQMGDGASVSISICGGFLFLFLVAKQVEEKQRQKALIVLLFGVNVITPNVKGGTPKPWTALTSPVFSSDRAET